MNATTEKPVWCEMYKVSGVLCIRRATMHLPVKLGELDQHPEHGFCDYHAGAVAILAVSQGGEESEASA